MITFGLLSSSLILRPLSVQSFSFNLMNYTDINATIIGLACLVLTLACAALLALRAPSSQTNGSSGVNSLEYQNGPMVRMIYAPNMQPRSDEDTVSDTRQQGEGDGGFRGVIRPRGRPSPSALPSPSPLPFYCLHNTRRRLAVKPLHLSRTLSRSIAAKALVRKV